MGARLARHHIARCCLQRLYLLAAWAQGATGEEGCRRSGDAALTVTFQPHQPGGFMAMHFSLPTSACSQ